MRLEEIILLSIRDSLHTAYPTEYISCVKSDLYSGKCVISMHTDRWYNIYIEIEELRACITAIDIHTYRGKSLKTYVSLEDPQFHQKIVDVLAYDNKS